MRLLIQGISLKFRCWHLGSIQPPLSIAVGNLPLMDFFLFIFSPKRMFIKRFRSMNSGLVVIIIRILNRDLNRKKEGMIKRK